MTIYLPTEYNSPEWFHEHEEVRMDRLSMLALVGAIEIALTKHTWKPSTEKVLKNVGRLMASRLLAQGYIASGTAKEAWNRLFGVRSI
jgi:hypothetical protein